jgi:DNA-binding response OmpR family regulator
VEGELIVATNGEMAIQFIHDLDSQPMSCPDLFIVDLSLPKRPGQDVLAYKGLSVKCRQAPVVVLTSSDSRQDREDARRLGVSQYIPKPLRLDEFIGLGAIFKAMIESSAH